MTLCQFWLNGKVGDIIPILWILASPCLSSVHVELIIVFPVYLKSILIVATTMPNHIDLSNVHSKFNCWRLWFLFLLCLKSRLRWKCYSSFIYPRILSNLGRSLIITIFMAWGWPMFSGNTDEAEFCLEGDLQRGPYFMKWLYWP